MWFKRINEMAIKNASEGKPPLRLEWDFYQDLEDYWHNREDNFKLNINKLEVNHYIPISEQSEQWCWRIIATYILSGDENKGNHHLYFDLLNEDGSRYKSNSPIPIPFSWRGMSQKELDNLPITLAEKPENEAYGNVHISSYDMLLEFPARTKNMIDGLPSDYVSGVNIKMPDSWENGNTMGHYSTYVVFMRTKLYNPIVVDTPVVNPEPTIPEDNDETDGGVVTTSAKVYIDRGDIVIKIPKDNLRGIL